MAHINKGNPNPSPETRFGAPNGNAPGKTSEQRAAEIKNAELATKIRTRFLNALHNVVEADTLDSQALERISGDILRLLRDAEDRGLGTPKTSVDISNPDGSLQREPIQAAVLAALSKIHGDSPNGK